MSVALEARLLLRRPLGRWNRFEPLIGNLLATFDGASVGAFDESLLGALNSGELSAQVIGLSLVEFLFVELRRGIRHLVLPSQLFPAGNAESSERLLDPDALAAKKVSGSFELHLVSAVLQTACRQPGDLESRTWAEISVVVPPEGDTAGAGPRPSEHVVRAGGAAPELGLGEAVGVACEGYRE